MRLKFAKCNVSSLIYTIVNFLPLSLPKRPCVILGFRTFVRFDFIDGGPISG